MRSASDRIVWATNRADGGRLPTPSSGGKSPQFRSANSCSGSVLFAGERGARNVGVPVDVRALRIVLPCPHMQRVKGREPKAVRAGEQVKGLPHHFRGAGMALIPLVHEDEKIGADQL